MELPPEYQIDLMITFGIIITLGLVISLFVMYYYSKKYILCQKLESQHEMVKAMVMTQEEERKRIAADLHDEVGSKLNIIYIYLQQIKKKGTKLNKIYDKLDELAVIVDAVINTTRGISHSLLPPILSEFGLIEALKDLCTSLNSIDNIKVNFNSGINSITIYDTNIELNLFRIAQELTNNSINHGDANEIDLDLSISNGSIFFSYCDNGAGFIQGDISKGLGLNNIESRIQVIGGKWEYQTKPNEGFQTLIQIPI